MTPTIVATIALVVAVAIGGKLLGGIAALRDPFSRVSRAFAALTLVLLASLPASSGRSWQLVTCIALGVLTAVTWGVGSLRSRRR